MGCTVNIESRRLPYDSIIGSRDPTRMLWHTWGRMVNFESAYLYYEDQEMCNRLFANNLSDNNKGF